MPLTTLSRHPVCWGDKSLITCGISSCGKLPLRPSALTVLRRGPRIKAIFPSHTAQLCETPWAFRWSQQRLSRSAEQHSQREHCQLKECPRALRRTAKKTLSSGYVPKHRWLTTRLGTSQDNERGCGPA